MLCHWRSRFDQERRHGKSRGSEYSGRLAECYRLPRRRRVTKDGLNAALSLKPRIEGPLNTNYDSSPGRRRASTCSGSEFTPEVREFFRRRRPVRLARVAVEHQRTGLQLLLEFFVTERHCLVMIVRTHNFEIDTLAHTPDRSASMRIHWFLWI